VITAVMARNMFAGAGAQQAAAAPVVPVGPKVLVAKKALPAGTIIDPDSFTLQPWPKELMQSAYYVEGQPDGDPKKLLGTVVRYPITAGQPVTRGSLVGPQDRGFLAAALGPGMRAITVPVNVSSGVAGFVFPGDHVDLVLTQQVQGGGDGAPLKVSETIIRNLRVLATDQRITDKDDEGKTQVKTLSKRSRSPRASARYRCRCARSPTILRTSSASWPPARSRSRPAPAPTRRSRC
jgi:pilus assembly protein CpaB